MTFKTFKDCAIFLYANPNFTGVCVVLHPGGQRRYEFNFVDGVPLGKQLEWFTNGQKSYEENLVNGKKHGKSIGWYSDGQKTCEYNFVNGFLIGIQLNGRKTYETKPEENNIWYIIVKEIL